MNAPSLRRQNVLKSVSVHGLLLFGAFLMTFPFIIMVLTSLKGPQEVLDPAIWIPRTKHYVEVADEFADSPELALVRILERGAGTAKVQYLTGDRKWLKEELPNEQIIEKRLCWHNYTNAWGRIRPSFTVYFWNSFVISALTTLGQVATSILAAYAFAFFDFPLKNVIFVCFLATMMVPQQVLLIPNFLMLKHFQWYDSYAALVVPWLAGVFGIFLLRQFFLQIPRDLYDAAVIDGCGRLGFLVRILVPLSVPPILTISIFTFLSSWNSLLWPLIVTESANMRTIQVALSIFNQAEGTNWELLMAASTFCILPLVVAYFFAQKQFIQGIARTGLKG